MLFSDPLLDGVGRVVGHATWHILPAPGEDLCRGVVTLDGRGTVTVDGVAPHVTGPFSMAVTGGTGEFSGTRGQLDLEPLADAQRLTLRLRS